MSMNKYGTFITFQNTETDEVIEIALADEEGIKKYAGDNKWRELSDTELGSRDSDESTSTQEEKL